MANIDAILAPGQSVNKQLLRQYLASREISRPQDYGAKGDGIHDDTDAINQALTNDRTVFLPPGNYRTTAAINLVNGCTLIGTGETSVIQARDTPYNDVDPGNYSSDFNAIEITAGYNLIQNLKIVGGGTGIKLFGRDNPCVKNVLENLSIWDTQHGLIFDGWQDTNKPCYWNQASNILIARPKVNGVLFTITPENWNDPDTYGDTPNANKLDNVRVYSLSAPMSGCGFNISSGRYANSFSNCEANLHQDAQACFRLGFNTDTNFIRDFYAESHGALPAIQIDNGSVNTSIHNLFSASGGAAIWDPTQHRQYQAYNAGFPTKNYFKSTWITDLYLEAQTLGTIYIDLAADANPEVNLDLSKTIYLVSAYNQPLTLYLPNAHNAVGRIVTIKKTDFRTNAVTIKERDGNGPDNRTVVLANQYDRITAISNGATWWVISETNPPLNSGYIQYSDTTGGVYTPSMLQPVYLVSGYSGAVEFRLPLPRNAPGRMAAIKKIDPTGNHITITQTGGGGPDAQAQPLTQQFQGVTVFSDGGQWLVLSRT